MSATYIEFNTRRPYAENGQIIRAAIVDGVVVFQDCARGITGKLSHGNLSQHAIMNSYDAGEYVWCDFWKVREVLGFSNV